jgi:Phytanoyl-CoA dioxygenase (PhyH)
VTALSAVLDRDGVLICPNVLSREAARHLHRHFDGIDSERAGARSFDLPEDIRVLIGQRGPLGTIAATEAGESISPVRVLLFDKTPAANWAVPWHQDRTVVVKERHDVAGFGPWSVKDGVDHVEPPISVLEGMLTLRLFVDDCGDDNGPLEVTIGSHRFGRLPGGEMSAVVQRATVFVGVAGQGTC